VRELKNELERVCALATGPTTITKAMLKKEIVAHADASAPDARTPDAVLRDMSIPLNDRLRFFEIEQIRRALVASNYNLTHAASELGLVRQNLQRRLKKLNLKVPRS
jgi:transcriptional regulator with PAS, ATPase and Fis domain